MRKGGRERETERERRDLAETGKIREHERRRDRESERNTKKR